MNWRFERFPDGNLYFDHWSTMNGSARFVVEADYPSNKVYALMISGEAIVDQTSFNLDCYRVEDAVRMAFNWCEQK